MDTPSFSLESAEPGAVIAGRFELRHQIGVGGMGAVWSAWDRKARREVAVKRLTHRDSAMLLRFVREQSLRIEHPHVVAPSGWAADDDEVVLSMDLVRGGSVDTLIRDHGALPESFVAVLVHQLVDALAAIHGHGVVHRDIKPANLLLEATGDGRPYLRVADFGVAIVRDEPRLTETLMSIGTPGYMAPDLALGAEPAPLHDLYAAGVVGKRLLTGLPASEMPRQHESRLWPLLDWMTNLNPHQRPQTAEAVLQVMATEHLVPDGAPWANDPDAPFVFDQVGQERDADVAPLTEQLPRTTRRDGLVELPASAPTPERRRHRALRGIAIGSFLCSGAFLVAALVVLLRSFA